MKHRIAINGFGRIGRMVFRRACLDPSIEIVAVNASYPAKTLAHLVNYDTIHGKFPVNVKDTDDGLLVEEKKVKLLSSRNPEELPWKDLDIDVVVEATGKFVDREGVSKHLEAGAKRVVITAPGKNEDATIVMGVNEHVYNKETDCIISNASCTTNCLAPVVKVIHEAFGVENGLVTTVHAYTNDQLNLDNPHKDLRRARACGQSIIPTKTGAAKALGLVMPELAGKLNGMALRVPTPNVSVVDLVATLGQDVTALDVNRAFEKSSRSNMKGIIEYCDSPLVSSDFNGNEHSAILDASSTMVISDRQVKILAWYDNEWGYSCRVVDLVKYIDAK